MAKIPLIFAAALVVLLAIGFYKHSQLVTHVENTCLQTQQASNKVMICSCQAKMMSDAVTVIDMAPVINKLIGKDPNTVLSGVATEIQRNCLNG